ncbi:unnamed protein product [Parajaminaea phylloscopi]
MRSRAGQAAAESSAPSSSHPTATQQEPSSDAETEPLPFSEDEEVSADPQPESGMDLDATDREGGPTLDEAAAASALVESAKPQSPHDAISRGADEDSVSDSDLSDAPDERDLDSADRQADAHPEGEADGEASSLSDESDADADADAEADAEAEADVDADIGIDAATNADASGDPNIDLDSSLADGTNAVSGEQPNEAGNNSDSDDALGEDEDDEDDDEEEEDDDDDDDDEDEDEEEEGQLGQADQASALASGALARSGGRRARQERNDAALSAEGTQVDDDEEAASHLVSLGGGASQVDGAVEDEPAGTASSVARDLLAHAAAAETAPRTRKPSMLGPQLILDAASEAATSRQASAEPEAEDAEADAVAGIDEDDEAKGDGDAPEVKDAEMPADGDEAATSRDDPTQLQTDPDTAAGTPMPEQHEQEDDQATDEALIRRNEAMDTLTKIEIGFALLRDRLYVERTEEVSKETEMILDGTHPELIHLTALIEVRRQHRLRMVELWFEEEQRHYAKMAAAEEREAWLSWRHNVAELRRESMDDLSRKRRKLEREKRNLDAPRPARRHQIFETELIGDPELAAAAAEAAKADRGRGPVSRRRAAREAEQLADLGSHIALPDLRGLEDFEAWGDLERMGILRPELRMVPGTHHPQATGSMGPASAGLPHSGMPHHQRPNQGQSSQNHAALPHGVAVESHHLLPQREEAEGNYYGMPSHSAQWNGSAAGPPFASAGGPNPQAFAHGEMVPYGGPDGHVYGPPHEDVYAAEQHAMMHGVNEEYRHHHRSERQRPGSPPGAQHATPSRNGRSQRPESGSSRSYQDHVYPQHGPDPASRRADASTSGGTGPRAHQQQPPYPAEHQHFPNDEQEARDSKFFANGYAQQGSERSKPATLQEARESSHVPRSSSATTHSRHGRSSPQRLPVSHTSTSGQEQPQADRQRSRTPAQSANPANAGRKSIDHAVRSQPGGLASPVGAPARTGSAPTPTLAPIGPPSPSGRPHHRPNAETMPYNEQSRRSLEPNLTGAPSFASSSRRGQTEEKDRPTQPKAEPVETMHRLPLDPDVQRQMTEDADSLTKASFDGQTERTGSHRMSFTGPAQSTERSASQAAESSARPAVPGQAQAPASEALPMGQRAPLPPSTSHGP